MSAQPVEHEHDDPDDPVAILAALPEAHRVQFLAEYRAAATEAARDVSAYRALHDLLRMWRLTAVVVCEPSYEDRLREVDERVRIGDTSGAVSIEDLVPGWPNIR